jgi:tRNA pseudouridine55 synthase
VSEATPALAFVDKPEGWTSRRAGAVVSKGAGQKKFGHIGTLDPFATGLLPIAMGRGTRLLSFIDVDHKAYLAEVQLGRATSTGDRCGEAAPAVPIPPITQADVDRSIQRFVGEIEQRPPAFSAIRIDGERAYKKARRGETFEVPTRTVRIDHLAAELVAPDRLRLDVRCGTGTYIRTLGADFAEVLGTTGHLVSLRRTEVGPFRVEDAGQPDAEPPLWSLLQLLEHLGEAVDVPIDWVRHVRDGKPLDELDFLSHREPGRFALAAAGDPLALVELSAGTWRYLRGLPPRP